MDPYRHFLQIKKLFLFYAKYVSMSQSSCAHMTLLPSCGDNFVNDTERKLQKDAFCPREGASQKNSSCSLKTVTDYLTLI